MNEKPKRLAPKQETLRELFLKSGNLCAFPNCERLMMNREGLFVGQICHIEAAEKGGPRFNPSMSNEDRRSSGNLLLMCYEHHRTTDDVERYPVGGLRGMKQAHERRFSNPDRAMLEKLTDWTRTVQPNTVSNLRRLNDILKWGHTDSELESAIVELNGYIEVLQDVPAEVRNFVGAVAKRMHRMRKTGAVDDGLWSNKLLYSDFKSAHRWSATAIDEKLVQMEVYRLGGLDEIDTEFGLEPAIRLNTLKSGWALWSDVAQFSEETNTAIEIFAVDLDFTSFDD